MDIKALARKMAYFYDKPAEFVQTVLRVTPDAWQASALNAIISHNYVSIKSAHGVGKCESATDSILLSSGLYVQMKELIGTTQEVISFNEQTGKLEPSIAHFSDNGKVPCVRITTSLGRQRTITYNHPLLTTNKWVKAINLKPGTRIACTNTIPIEGKETIPEEVVKIIAYLIGDGCLTSSSSPSFTQDFNEQLMEFTRCVKAIGCELKSSRSKDYRIVGKDGEENTIVNLLNICGLSGCNSHTKFVPYIIFLLQNHLIATFLSRLFSTDGWASATDHGNKSSLEIGYCSVSHQLVLDIQRLMLRFGILGAIRKRQTSWTHKGEKKFSHAWDWAIHDTDAIIKFAATIGIFGKEEAVDHVHTLALRRQTTKHSGPATQGHSILDCGKRIRFFSSITGISTRNLPGQVGRTDNVSRTYAHIAAKILGDTFLEAITQPHISWDEITLIEDAGEQPTVAVSVPGNETYLTDHINHNSTTAAWLLLWFLMTRPYCKIPCTAPSKHQLNDILWADVSYWLHQSPLLEAALEWTSTKVAMKGYEADWFAVARTARVDPKGRVTEGLQGFHASHILYIVDEASGVDERVFSALEGGLTTANAHMFLIGNPTRLSGTFYRSHTSEQAHWYTDTITAIGNPHVRSTWVDRQKRKWGDKSPEYLIKVLGQFPEHISINSIIPRAYIELAIQRGSDGLYFDLNIDGTTIPPKIIWAIDIARFGGASTLQAVRSNNTLSNLNRLAPNTAPGTAVEIKNLYVEAKDQQCTPSQIRIDVGGGYGSGVFDILMLDPELSKIVRPINVGWAARDPNAYINLRAEAFWNLKRGFEDLRFNISPSCGFTEELMDQCADLKYTLTAKEKIQIELKENFMARNQGQSPDEADAAAMVFLDNYIEGAFGPEDTTPGIISNINDLMHKHSNLRLLARAQRPWASGTRHTWRH